jgi:DNA-binding NtrC family response regulator
MMGKNKQTILIVADSTFIINKLVAMFEDMNSQKINKARTFTQVAGLLEENISDIILLNLNSLDSVDFGLLSIFKDLYTEISVTILSQKFNRYYLKQWKKIGAGYFIEKESDIEKVKVIRDIKKNMGISL